MSEEQQQLFLIRGAIASSPLEDQQKVHAIATEIRALVEKDVDHGMVALALVGAELQAQA